MKAPVESLWLRALHVVDVRGLLPANTSSLTPRELAVEIARRGEDRLIRLVDSWYYAASYGRVAGKLSDEEAGQIVAALEAGMAFAQIEQEAKASAASVETVDEAPAAPRKVECDLCGYPLPPNLWDRGT